MFSELDPGLPKSVRVIPGQERGRELGGGAFAFAAFAPRAPVAARSAIVAAPASAAVTPWPAIAIAAAVPPAIAPRPAVAAFTRLSRRPCVGKLLAGLLVDEAH